MSPWNNGNYFPNETAAGRKAYKHRCVMEQFIIVKYVENCSNVQWEPSGVLRTLFTGHMFRMNEQQFY